MSASGEYQGTPNHASSEAGPGPASQLNRNAVSDSPEGDARQRKRRRVTRTRLGCLTCRKRRKRCDMTKPECCTCQRLKLTCEYPRPGVLDLWTAGHGSDILRDDRAPSNQGLLHTSPSTRISSSETMDDFVNIFGQLPRDDDLAASNVRTLAPASHMDLGGTGSFDWEVDEATLQAWAADCLNLAASQAVALTPPEPINPPSESVVQTPRLANVPTRHASSAPSRPLPSSASHARLLHYFHDSLVSLLSCTGEAAPSAFEAFSKLANASAGGGLAAQGLHLSILAWTGRHLANRGQAEYEAVCERLGSQATNIVMGLLDDRTAVIAQTNDSNDDLTLLAAGLMIMQFKISRGDVWGYDLLTEHLAALGAHLYKTSASGPPQCTSMYFQFFENLVYHDILSSFIVTRGPMVSYDVLVAHNRAAPETLHTLTGLSLPLFIKMHRIAALIRLRRNQPGGRWTDEALVDIAQSAEEIESELKEDKRKMAALVVAKPHLAPHRYLHEAFRVACLMQLRSCVFGEPSSSLSMRLLVRQSLSLLEAMCDQDLPGYCSAHWVIFMTGVCAAASGQQQGELDDRERIDRLYDDFFEDFPFMNVPRSRKLVREVWARNEGRIDPVDWLDVVVEYDWEVYLV